MPEAEIKNRTYGNLVVPRRPGIFGLGMLPTIGLLVSAIVDALLILAIGILPTLVLVAIEAPVFLWLLKPAHDGRTPLSRINERVAGFRGRRKGRQVYSSGPTGRVPYGTHQLPGVLGPSQLSEAQDAFGRPFAVLAHPWTRQVTVVIETEPDGASLADQWQIDQWVAHHGQWLAILPTEPGLTHAQISIEAAPDPGTRLSYMLRSRRDPNAPAFAGEVLDEIEQTYPSGAAEVRARIALTYTLAGAGRRQMSVTEKANEISLRLSQLVTELSNTGAGAGRPCSAERLSEIAMEAYSPSKAMLIEQLRGNGQASDVLWEDAGPAQAYTDSKQGLYFHDGAASRTWMMSGAPRGHFRESVLTELLAAHGDVPRKRVTLLYRILSPGEAASVVERDVTDSQFRVRNERRPSPRSRMQAAAAGQTSDEEARGASIVMLGMLVTGTVLDSDGVDEMDAAIANVAPAAKISLRLPRAGQDALFAASLPFGVWLPDHLQISQSIQEAM